VSFEVITAVSMKVALMMEAASTSETPVNFYQTTRRKNSEDSHLHTRRRENLKSRIFKEVLSGCQTWSLTLKEEHKLGIIFSEEVSQSV
jgi:hypothetical protein